MTNPSSKPGREREFVIDNPLVRIHLIIVMIRWTGLAPWEFEPPFPCSLTPTNLGEIAHGREWPRPKAARYQAPNLFERKKNPSVPPTTLQPNPRIRKPDTLKPSTVEPDS